LSILAVRQSLLIGAERLVLAITSSSKGSSTGKSADNSMTNLAGRLPLERQFDSDRGEFLPPRPAR
jgi:hypothetical protein